MFYIFDIVKLICLIEFLYYFNRIILLIYNIINHKDYRVIIYNKIQYNILFVYTYCENLYNNYIHYTNTYVLNNKNYYTLTIIHNGIIIFSNKYDKSSFIEINDDTEYDMLDNDNDKIYITNPKLLQDINKYKDISYNLVLLDIHLQNKNVIYKDITKLLKFNNNINYTPYTFIHIEVNYNNTKYSINLKQKDKYNYYIVDNIIDKDFIRYYLVYYYSISPEDIDINNFYYTMRLLDGNVNLHRLDETKSIILKKENYEIIDNK